ncbi:MAG: hypothetical protein M1587_01080 [Thaumarchaeota archaeon]|nr:hypothetical protein [Nitrososphaerota archaeon]
MYFWKASAKHKLGGIAPQGEKDVKQSLRELKEGRFTEGKNAEELISWLR